MHFTMTVKYLWVLSFTSFQFPFDFHLQHKWVFCRKSCCCIKNEWCVIHNSHRTEQEQSGESAMALHTLEIFFIPRLSAPDIWKGNGKFWKNDLCCLLNSLARITLGKSSWELNLQFNSFLIAFWDKSNCLFFLLLFCRFRNQIGIFSNFLKV